LGSVFQLSGARPAALIFLGWVTLSLVTAVVGPFSTFDTMPIGVRVLYWGGIIGASMVFGEGIRRLVARFPTQGPLQADLLGSVLMAPVFGAVITVFNLLIGRQDGTFTMALGTNVLVVLLVCFGIVVFRAYMRHHMTDRGVPEDTARPSESPDSLPGFLREIDPEIGRSVNWIAADDHYLHVHGPTGSARVLMRFRDALEDLSDLPGLQVHRSHWVRIGAITELRPDGRRHVVVLPCGTEVPVSRSFLPGLRMAGVLADDGASERR